MRGETRVPDVLGKAYGPAFAFAFAAGVAIPYAVILARFVTTTMPEAT
jgi:hypothetical protein